MISENEINILKNLLVGKSIAGAVEVLRASVEDIGLIGVKLEDTFTNEIWNNYADKIIFYYTSNIQKPSKRRLRKKIELLNAKKGFIIPEDLLLAKKSVKTIPKQRPQKKLSKAKLEAIEKEAKLNIYIYFQRLNHAKEIYKIYNSSDIFKNLKNHMLELYESDKEVYNRLIRKKDFSGLCKCLPKMKSSESTIKLYKFKQRSKEYHLSDGSNSIHAISIPMGGRNK